MKSISTRRYNSASFVLAGSVFVLLFFAGSVSAQSSDKEVTVPGESGLKWINTGITVAARRYGAA